MTNDEFQNMVVDPDDLLMLGNLAKLFNCKIRDVLKAIDNTDGTYEKVLELLKEWNS